MPLPLLVWAGYAVGAASLGAAGAEVLSGEQEEFAPPEAMRRLAAAVINWLVGENLVSADDLTGKAAIDGALARLVSSRAPFVVSSVLDKELLTRDLLNGAASMVAKKAGFPVRSLLDMEMLKEDLLSAAAGLLEQRTGVKLNNLRDAGQVKADLLAYGANRIAVETGIYLSNPADLEQVKADIIEHGTQIGMARIVEDLQGAMNAADKDGVRLSALLSRAGMNNVKPADMVKNANSVLLRYADRRFAQVKAETKKEKRKIQLKEAQRRFRARHCQPWSPMYSGIPGGMQYVSVGGYKAGAGKEERAGPVQEAPVADVQQGAGYKPSELSGQTMAKWAKDGKFNAGREELPMSRPATPAGVSIGRKK